jgi:hypothetical protein
MGVTFFEGQRVAHARWLNRDNASYMTGTVHMFPNARPGEERGEVQWDGIPVADTLSMVADYLRAPVAALPDAAVIAR